MFERDLENRFKRIFGIKKTTYDAPNYEAPEQDTLFIEILEVRSRMSSKSGGRATCKVIGAAVVFSQATKLPFGFFAKRVEQAALADTGNLIFEREIDVPGSPARLINLHERRMGFTFLYDTQYDPDRGDLTRLTISLSEH